MGRTRGESSRVGSSTMTLELTSNRQMVLGFGRVIHVDFLNKLHAESFASSGIPTYVVSYPCASPKSVLAEMSKKVLLSEAPRVLIRKV